MESILTSIKKLLGISEEDTSFDPDVIMHINSVISLDLAQLGIGDGTFAISGNTETWDQYLPPESNKFAAVKTYIYLKLKPVFDPPQSQVAMDAINRRVDQLEWRLNVRAEKKSNQSEVNS